MGAVWNAFRQRGAGWCYETLKLLLASPRDFLDANFESDKVKAMMAAWGLHLDFAPDIAGGALFPYLESMANQAFGMVIGQGGADTIIKAMVKSIEERRGEVRLGARVASIDVSAGAATGVTLASGERLAARHVIANVHPKLVFGTLMKPEARTRRYREALDKFRSGPGTMMVHLALDDLPNWRAGEALRRFAYVHIGPNLEMMGRVYAQASAGLLPEEPLLVVGQPTAIDPTRAPAGKHILWVQVRVVPSVIRGDAAGKIAARNWDEAKEPFAERVLDLIEAHAPGFAGARAWPCGRLAARSRTRKSEPDRRRQSLRQPSSRSELLPASRARLVELCDADSQSASLRRLDLAGRRHRRGLRLPAGPQARGLIKFFDISNVAGQRRRMAEESGVLHPDLEILVQGAGAGRKTQLRLWLRMLAITKTVSQEMRSRLRASFGATLPQFDLMAQLYREPKGLRLGELSRRTMVTNGNVTGLADRLEAEGLIRRETLDEDRRVTVARLTPLGRERFTEMARAHEGWLKELMADVDDDTLQVALAALAEVKASAGRRAAGA